MARSRVLPPGTALRMTADAVMVNAALFVAFLFRFLILLVSSETGQGLGPEAYSGILWEYIGAYTAGASILTVVCLAVFYFSGFYTHGRAYRGRYKALIIAQAVSLAYVIFGSLSVLVGDVVLRPRSVIVIAWFFTLIALELSRLWSHFWTHLIRAERSSMKGSPAEPRSSNVLVIGGAGYVGSALVPKLLDKGYKVCLFDLLLFGTDPIAGVLGHPNLEMVEADFRQVDRVVQAMRGIDAVVHLGAIVGDPACSLDEDLTIEVNLMATRMIAEVAKGSGVQRFVFASTCSVYGESDQVLDERSALNPASLYARTKTAAENVLLKMAHSDFCPVILRLATIYGISGRPRFDLVVNLLAAQALVEGKITVVGGNQYRPFVHVDDAASAIVSVLDAPLLAVEGQILNVGSDEQNFTIHEIGQIVHRLVPSAELIKIEADTDQRNYRGSFAKIKRLLGFTPRWTVEEGVQQVIESIKSGRVKDHRDAKYSNVRFLTEEATYVAEHTNWVLDLLAEASAAQASTSAAKEKASLGT